MNSRSVRALVPMLVAVFLCEVAELFHVATASPEVLLLPSVIYATYVAGLTWGLSGTILSAVYLLVFARYHDPSSSSSHARTYVDVFWLSLFFAVTSILTARVRRRSEKLGEALAKRAELVQALDYSSELIFFLDSAGKITEVNKVARERLGVPSDMRPSYFSLDDYQPDELSETRRDAIRTASSHGSWRGHTTFKPNSGTPFECFEVLAAHFDSRRRLVGFTSVCRDISEHVRVQEELARANRDLHELNQSLEQLVRERAERLRAIEVQRSELGEFIATGRMAARVAHEINNPLASIRNVGMLLKRLGPGTPEAEQWLGVLDKEVGRIATIVSQMYRLYPSTDGALSETSLAHLLTEIEVLTEARFSRRGVRLETSLDHPESIILTSESMVKQIVIALLYNALEASGVGQRVSLHVEPGPEDTLFHVKDLGTGIEESTQRRLFEPFFTTKRSDGSSSGVGLGLSVSRSLARALGGELDFVSTVGVGSTFTLRLPSKGSVAARSRERIKRTSTGSAP